MKLTQWLEPLAWLSAWHSYLSGSTHLAMRLGFGRRATRSQLEHTAFLTTVNRPGIQARGNIAMFNWDATGALSGLTVPVLVIGADMDIVTKHEASESIVAQSSSARLLTLQGANHMGFLEQAGICNQAIRDFAMSLAVRPSHGRQSEGGRT